MTHADPLTVNIQQGATGIDFTAQLLNAAGAPIPIPATPDTAEFRFKRPQGAGSEAVIAKAATVVDAALGTLIYTVPDNEPTFLAPLGEWSVQVFVRDTATGPYRYGPVRRFKVDPNLA